MINGTAISGNSERGGSANAPVAPEKKAMARLRQPEDRMTPSMSQDRPLAGGAAVELAMLKLPRLLVARIAISDLSAKPLDSVARVAKVLDRLARDFRREF